MTYTQLTSLQRYQIKSLMQAEQSPTKKAEIIGVARSTIYREIKRNTGNEDIDGARRMKKQWKGDGQNKRGVLQKSYGKQ